MWTILDLFDKYTNTVIFKTKIPFFKVKLSGAMELNGATTPMKFVLEIKLFAFHSIWGWFVMIL